MKRIQVNTGFGYFVKDGKVIGHARLPIGEHKTKEHKKYVEVANQAELDAIQIYRETASEADRINIKIHDEIRALAIASLKQKGELPEDYG